MLWFRTVLFLCLFVAFSDARSQWLDFDFLSSTPIGSWQKNEQITTNHKGKQSGTSTRMSMVGKEERNGETHYWLEMAVQNFKISKKGKRKNKGKRTISKSLIPKSLFSADPANIMSNLSKFGTEIIVQNGDEDPMRISNSGSMMAGVTQFANVDIQYDFEPLGSELVSVSAGEFETKKIAGKGSAEITIVIKKMRVESDLVKWYSEKVPFGIVKSEGTTTTNGRPSRERSELIEFGMTGAVTEIVKPVKDMPAMPSLGEIFGK